MLGASGWNMKISYYKEKEEEEYSITRYLITL